MIAFVCHVFVVCCAAFVSCFFWCKQETAYEMSISDWSSDVCSSDLFVWLGTTLPLDTFTFIFQANEHGLFQVHAYRFEDGLSTFIVETTEETWRRAWLEQASEADTIAYCETLFPTPLQGQRLIGNRSIWRCFPTVKFENRSDEHTSELQTL